MLRAPVFKELKSLPEIKTLVPSCLSACHMGCLILSKPGFGSKVTTRLSSEIQVGLLVDSKVDLSKMLLILEWNNILQLNSEPNLAPPRHVNMASSGKETGDFSANKKLSHVISPLKYSRSKFTFSSRPIRVPASLYSH